MLPPTKETQMPKPSDLPPEVQAAAIVSSTHLLLEVPSTEIGTFKHIPTPKDVVKHAIEILKEYAAHRDMEI
jgi:hypothetical protein